MAKQPNVVVGIDIGTRYIKMAEVRAGRPWILTGIAIGAVPEGAVDTNGILSPPAVATTIKKLMGEGGISAKQAVFSLAGQNSVVVRVLEVPKMNPNELRQHMDWEVQRNIPFADTRVQSAYEVIQRPDAPPDAQNMEVVLAVAQQDAVDRIVTVADAAGLEPIGIDVEPLALGRSLLLSQEEWRDRSAVVVNIGASSTSIDIYRHGLLSFPRILPLGSDTFTRAIAERMMISESEAEQAKIQYAEVLMEQAPVITPFAAPTFGAPGGFDLGATVPPTPFDISTPFDTTPSEPEISSAEEGQEPPEADQSVVSGVPAPSSEDRLKKQEVFRAIYPVLEELVSELRRSIEYYRSRTQDGQLDQILLCGGAAIIPNLDQLLSSSLGIPTSVANPYGGLQVNVRRYGPDVVVANAHLLAVAIGMALHPFF